MNIYKYVPNQRSGYKNTVVALGFFDGVHAAHRELIKETLRIAKERSLTPLIFTFTSEGDIKNGVPRIYSTEQKLSLIEEMGIHDAVVANFSDISDISAEEFVSNTLIADLGACVAVAGYNFRFGKGALGSSEELLHLMKQSGGEAKILPEILIEGNEVSSTAIRTLIESGNVRKANKLLSSPYFILGKVESGNHVGKTLGFPTVNIPLAERGVIIRRGVYSTAVEIDKKMHVALTNVGTCPTFNERKMHTETYILDYNSEIYGKEIKIYFLDFLREEKKFDSPSSLVEEINRNIAEVMKGKVALWQEAGLK